MKTRGFPREKKRNLQRVGKLHIELLVYPVQILCHYGRNITVSLKGSLTGAESHPNLETNLQDGGATGGEDGDSVLKHVLEIKPIQMINDHKVG